MKIVLLIFLISSSTCFAQQQERTVLIYNVGFGGVTSGIGALINKPKGSNWKKTFVKTFWQGSIGGLLNYSSKKTLYLNNQYQNNNFSWPSKILHSAATSIMENAALNEPFLQNWNIDYGPVRFDFSINNKKKCKIRFLPTSIYALIAVSRYGKFDLKNTLETGNIVFSSKDILRSRNGGTNYGISFGRAIIFSESYTNKNRLLVHEMIHQYQYGEYGIFNAWLKPIGLKVKSRVLKNIFSNYVYTDIPFGWASYNLAGHFKYPHYFRNFYEFEAERFATNSFVPR